MGSLVRLLKIFDKGSVIFKVTEVVEFLMLRFPMLTSFFLCLFKPYRLLYRIKKRRLFYRKPRQSSKGSNRPHILNARDGIDTAEAVDTLLEHGVLVLENYFDRDQVLAFKEKYRKFISIPKSDFASADGDVLPLSQDLIGMWKDETLVDIVQQVINHEVFGRDYPRFTMVHPGSNPDGTVQCKNTASEFHVDHVSIVAAAVFFSDVTLETSRMQVLSGTHRFLIYPLKFSKKVQQVFLEKFELLDCVGGIGSVQIHVGDVLHRIMPVAESDRLWVQYPFSDGHNILFDPWSMMSSLPPQTDQQSFGQLTKDRFFDGLYPKMPFKGYSLRNGKIYPVEGNNI